MSILMHFGSVTKLVARLIDDWPSAASKKPFLSDGNSVGSVASAVPFL